MREFGEEVRTKEIFRKLQLSLIYKYQSTLTEPMSGEYKVYRITRFESNNSYHILNGLMGCVRLSPLWSDLTR